MLSEKFRYIALDFETTGLDYKKDEPIQIGIVEFDKSGKIISVFSSLIKPKKNISELKGIVGFITGLSLSDLENSPNILDLSEQILYYFDENTIIIGHNIQFDVDFLEKYFPDIKFKNLIDTYSWSLNFIHFAPSYALEVLIEYLLDKDGKFKIFFNEFKIYFDKLDDNSTYHDALFDSKMSGILFFYLVGYIEKLFRKYIDLYFILQQQKSLLSELFGLKLNIDKHHFSVPVLEKFVPKKVSLSRKSDTIVLDKLENHSRYYVGNILFKNLITRLAGNKKILLAFSHKQKLDMAKHILQDLGISDIGFVQGNQIINYNVFNAFVNKGEFSEDELFFILKYFSHFQKGLGILDLNVDRDYKIFALLKDEKIISDYSLVLATHGGLYNLIQQYDKFRDYKIIFFDQERWYRNFNMYLSHSCNLYYDLKYLENLQYVYGVRNNIKIGKYNEVLLLLDDFIKEFQMFMGILFLETRQVFNNINLNYSQFEPILENKDFDKTNQLWNKLLVKKKKLNFCLLGIDSFGLNEHFFHIESVLSSLMMINKKSFKHGELYFVYKEAMKYTQWNEFLDFFSNQKIVFFSNISKQYQYLDFNSDIFIHSDVQKIYDLGRVFDYVERLVQNKISGSLSCFILSSLKDQSKELFEMFYNKNIHHNVLLLAENITGGIGKSVFKAKNSDKKIMIGSYNFLMWLISKGITIDNLIVFNIKGKSEDLMFNDIMRYS